MAAICSTLTTSSPIFAKNNNNSSSISSHQQLLLYMNSSKKHHHHQQQQSSPPPQTLLNDATAEHHNYCLLPAVAAGQVAPNLKPSAPTLETIINNSSTEFRNYRPSSFSSHKNATVSASASTTAAEVYKKLSSVSTGGLNLHTNSHSMNSGGGVGGSTTNAAASTHSSQPFSNNGCNGIGGNNKAPISNDHHSCSAATVSHSSTTSIAKPPHKHHHSSDSTASSETSSSVATTSAAAASLVDGGGGSGVSKQHSHHHSPVTKPSLSIQDLYQEKKSLSSSDLNQLGVRQRKQRYPSSAESNSNNAACASSLSAASTQRSPSSDDQINELSPGVLQGGSELGSPVVEVSSSADDIHEKIDKKRRSLNERRFHKLFSKISTEEPLLSRFTCAYVGDTGWLIQGYLYVSYNWICFHSNIFGIEKSIEIPVDSVMAVTKEKTAKIIPNAVGIRTDSGKHYLFGSLLSRDNTHQLLISVVTSCRTRDSSFYSFDGDVGENGISMPVCVLSPQEDEEEEEEDCSSEMSSDTHSADEAADVDLMQIGNKPSSLYTRRGKVSHKKHLSIANQTTSLSLRATLQWFISLPRIILFVIIASLLLLVLFICATFLTWKLFYSRSDHTQSRDILASSSEFNHYSKGSLGKIEAVVDASLLLLREVRESLESLRSDVLRNIAGHVNVGSADYQSSATTSTGYSTSSSTNS